MFGTLLQREKRNVQPGNVGPLSWPDYLRLWEQFGFNGVQYMVPAGGMAEMTALQASRNPIIVRCMMLRGSVFSQIAFKWRDKKTGKLFGDASLALLEQPFIKGSTSRLLARMEFDISRYGNSYWWKRPTGGPAGGPSLLRLDPTRVNILTGDIDGPQGKTCGEVLLGYQLVDKMNQATETFLPSEILHYWGTPDPTHAFRGLSWLSSLLPDITADQDLTDFKHAFINNAATPNMVVTFDKEVRLSKESLNEFRDMVETKHTGPASAFKTLYLGPGADAKVVGADLEKLQLSATQSIGEVRLCAAAGVPAALAYVAEGLKGSTLNTGNYAATRRAFSDTTIRPLWQMACGAAGDILPPPYPGAELWYDESRIAFLQADQLDAAQTRQRDATTIQTLVNSGYEPESVVAAVAADDITQLVHTGLLSVQLQPTGTLPGDPGGDALAPADVPADVPTDDGGQSGGEGQGQNDDTQGDG